MKVCVPASTYPSNVPSIGWYHEEETCSSSETPSPSVSPQSAYPSFTQFPGMDPSFRDPASHDVSEYDPGVPQTNSQLLVRPLTETTSTPSIEKVSSSYLSSESIAQWKEYQPSEVSRVASRVELSLWSMVPDLAPYPLAAADQEVMPQLASPERDQAPSRPEKFPASKSSIT